MHPRDFRFLGRKQRASGRRRVISRKLREFPVEALKAQAEVQRTGIFDKKRTHGFQPGARAGNSRDFHLATRNQKPLRELRASMRLAQQAHAAVETVERQRKHALAHQFARHANRLVVIPNRLGLGIEPDRVVIDRQHAL